MKRIISIFLASAMMFILLAGCSASAEKPETKSTAMYVTFGKDGYVMVNQETRSAFTVTMPEKIYDISGKQITAEELQNGNILEITGDGVVMETYPEQYPGVTEIRVIDEGDPKNTEQYQDIVDMVYTEPDPSEPPSMHVERHTETFASATLAVKGNYQWKWIEDEATGTGRTAIACGPHILEWENMNSVDLGGTENLYLIFYQEPDTVQVSRWPESSLGKSSETSDAEAESVETASEEGVRYIQAEPGYVYSVYAKWGESYVEYGFITQKEK